MVAAVYLRAAGRPFDLVNSASEGLDAPGTIKGKVVVRAQACALVAALGTIRAIFGVE
jgi:hypothetical protein